MKSTEIRQKFFDFFTSKGHRIVPSAPIVTKDDPTLMFTNAGMNQFKEYFLGHSKAPDTRIANSQKCLRVSGKHNDLEEVGKDSYHHTMFEMLGNWSFGDYFKEEAIAWAWELLTKEYGIDSSRLYVTVFEGDKQDGLQADTEARALWKNWLPEDRILMGNKRDNFWEMGVQGPCGPSSEIHIDLRSDEEREKISGRDLVNKDHPQVIEIWNLVFMEYNRKEDGSLDKLPSRHVDTGMGFERLAMVLQGVQSNYDTDIFSPLIREIEVITGHSYGKDESVDTAIRVVSDHIRAVAFSIADGQLPSNTGAGYVIRRILRRAVRYGFTFLDRKEAFIYKLVPVLVKVMGEAFPEIKSQKQLITNVIKEEENSFLRTLEQGLQLLEGIIAAHPSGTIPGEEAFELFDTFGFPVDLTALILRERGLTLDEEGFRREMQKQKARSRAATDIQTGDWVVLREDDREEFVGYDMLEVPVKITRYRKIHTKKDGDIYQLVFNLTPFYPEGGGQVGDKGYLETDNAGVIYILDTKKENNLIVHYTKTLPADLSATFRAVVDGKQRQLTACNHTATHLLHFALRKILGEHVQQKGSAVHSRYLRFDFSHFAKLSQEQIREVEDFVNARIREAIDLQEYRNIPMQEALDKGALAFFGEKYGDTVRMIQFGDSKELCGGTHVKNTRDLWHFKIVSEGATAAGIRRIEAITSDAVKQYFTDNDTILSQVRARFKNPADPVKNIEILQEENHRLKGVAEHYKRLYIKYLKSDLTAKMQRKGNCRFLAFESDLDAQGIKDLLYELGSANKDIFIICGSKQGDKALLSLYISPAMTEKYPLHAGKIIRELATHIQGGGGGQAFFATAGGKNPRGIRQALSHAEEYVLPCK